MSKKFLSPIKLAQGASNPAVGSAGELFFNTTDVKVYAHNGTSWVPSGGGVTVSATAPSTPIAGDAWYDTVDGTLYVYYNDGDSSQWVEVAANSGISVALEGRLGVVETYVTTLQSEMDTAQADIDAVESRALSLETRAAALELADSTTNKSGLVPIIPSSVSVSSGSASFSQNKITFSLASGVSINGIFSSQFTNYRIIISGESSGQHDFYARLRASGADNTAANHYFTGIRMYRTTTNAEGGDSTTWWRLGQNSAGFWHHTFEAFNPYVTTRTDISSTGWGYGGADASYVTHGTLNNTSLYDGVTFFTSTGTITGSAQIYGYR